MRNSVKPVSAVNVRPKPRPGGRHGWATGLLVIGLVTIAWQDRYGVLAAAGRLLIREDPVTPVEMIIVSNADPAADALEAARMYRDGVSQAIVVPSWIPEPLDAELRQLGVPHLRTTELAQAVLERSGVPPAAIERLPTAVDGTSAEIKAVATFARHRRPHSLLYITARTHSARARWVLRRALSPAIQVSVRSPRTDLFTADTWWRQRDDSREVAMEYLRWVNTIILHDPWGGGLRGP